MWRSTLAFKLPTISTSDAITEKVCPDPRTGSRTFVVGIDGIVGVNDGASSGGFDLENMIVRLQELEGVHRFTILTDLEMQMRPGRTARAAHPRNLHAALYGSLGPETMLD